jgi:hypothetical protein
MSIFDYIWLYFLVAAVLMVFVTIFILHTEFRKGVRTWKSDHPLYAYPGLYFAALTWGFVLLYFIGWKAHQRYKRVKRFILWHTYEKFKYK